MFIGSYLSDFLHECQNVRGEHELHALLCHATVRLGFEQFALNHHVDLVGPPEDAIVLLNYDPAWVERSLSRGYHLDDPVHVASARASFGFAWRDMGYYLQPNDRHRRILDEARHFGLCEGFTVPVHVPGEYRGTCSFSARNVSLTWDRVAATQLVGQLAFESARRLVRARRGEAPPSIPLLTRRQLGLLPFVAGGKSNWAIGQMIGLSAATVRQHLGDAMHRYGVATRTQLVVRALFDGQMVYNAAFQQ
ncbi:LuxR family transcriptional regulator [Flavisphingomonas formosensis]|uniref:LuxR family transcriptional regulator n=1 Tax=Flavisphingomonas formosensis TaxID=861534 RepID=UPI0018E01C41|nr:LuxR family transcriptional regulator [Sphingomonas formosensis]